MKKRGVTLIELMIVVAILAFIISIALPVFVRSKTVAKRTTCAGNLRQLHLAHALYATFNDGWYPPYGTHTVYSANRVWIKGAPEAWKNSLRIQGGADELQFWCPLDNYKGDPTLIGSTESVGVHRQEFTSYQMSAVIGPNLFGSPDGSLRLNPDSLPGTLSRPQSEIAFLHDTIWDGPKIDPMTGEAPFVSHHNQTATFLYLDGHTKNEPIQ